MRAVLMRDRVLSVDDVAEPEPGPGEVVVDVLACGICGSDLHCAQHGSDFNAASRAALGVELMDLERPVVFGHEFVGRIADHGPGTERSLPVGTRVVSVAALLRDPRGSSASAGPRSRVATRSACCSPRPCSSRSPSTSRPRPRR